MTLEFFQNYWWVLISVLGGILVFLLFVQGGQSMLFEARSETDRALIVNSMGRKWELTFTTLVTFGGAMFASFPLFYSTSFGGAYWLWILILFTFVLQAISYEYRSKGGNIFGRKTYDMFLFINGTIGVLLLGVAVSMFFFGGEFTVNRANLTDIGNPVISTWAPTHGFEAIFNWKNLILGVAVIFLARSLACMYMINNVSHDSNFTGWLRRKCFINSGIFLVFFLWFAAMLFTSTGYTVISSNAYGTVVEETPFKYSMNMTQGWWIGLTFLIGVMLVLTGIIRACFCQGSKDGIWYAGIGTFLTVVALFWAAGFMNTPFYPSLTDPGSSLTLANASSSKFTLEVMSYVSLLIPFVVAYIAYVWHSMDKKKLTPKNVEGGEHAY